VSIRIPQKADLDTQNAFKDVAEELQSIDELRIAVRDLQRQMDGQQKQLDTVNPVPTLTQLGDTSVVGDLRVDGSLNVRGDVDAPQILDGLVVATPAGTGDASISQRVVEVHASLAVLNALQADTIFCRSISTPGQPSCLLTRTTNQAISTGGAPTAIIWTVETFDTGGMYNSAANTRITFPASGVYLIGGSFQTLDNGAGTYRQTTLLIDGTVVATDYLNPAAYVNVGITILRAVAAGSYAELKFVHDKGSDLEIVAGANYSPLFWAVKLG